MTNPSTSPVLQRAVPSRYHFSTARALYTMRGAASVPLGPLLQCAVPPQYRFGTARALYYNARRRLGTASVPLGPSITMRGADTRLRFTKF